MSTSWTTTSCPNLTLGVPVVESLARATDTPLDCHLMIEDPDRWAPAVRRGGRRRPSPSTSRPPPRRCGSPGRSAPRAPAPPWRSSPRRPIEPYEDLLPELDMLLIMTVEPGFGGQAFLDIMLPKIRRTRELIGKHGLELWLQVDGGVSAATIERCAEAGADVFVAGFGGLRGRRTRPRRYVPCAPRRRRRPPGALGVRPLSRPGACDSYVNAAHRG